MNIINTRFSPPRRARINPRSTVTKRYAYNPATKKVEEVGLTTKTKKSK